MRYIRLMACLAAMPCLVGSSCEFFSDSRRPQAAREDKSFGVDGSLVISTALSDLDVVDSAVAANGRVVVLGEGFTAAGDWALIVVQFSAGGELVTSFGNGGSVVIGDANGRHERAAAIAIGAGGEIWIAGSVESSLGRYDFALYKLTSSGELDTTFGIDGMVAIDFGGSDYCTAMAIRKSNGSISDIVLAGTTHPFPIENAASQAAIAVVTTDGNLKETFAAGGLWTHAFMDRENSVAEIKFIDDSIIFVGDSFDADENRALFLGKFNETLEPDHQFGESGFVTTELPDARWDRVLAMDIRDDEVYVAVGEPEIISKVCRYSTATGLGLVFGKEPYFPHKDFVTTWFEIGALSVGPRVVADRFLVAGTSVQNAGSSTARPLFFVDRFRSDLGRSDYGFGPVWLYAPKGLASARGRTMAIPAHGRIVVIGTAIRSEDFGSVILARGVKVSHQ